MFSLREKVHERECAVIIDIGSGSVAAAILVSNLQEASSTFVWSRREFIVISDSIEAEISLKNINTSLINVFLQLGSSGLKELQKFDEDLKITHMQVTVSAPWAHTVIKQVNYTDDHPFTVTEELLGEISEAAHKKALTAILENTELQEKGAFPLDSQNIGVITNGYNAPNAIGAETRELSIAHLTALTQKRIVDVLEESKQKLLPKTKLYSHSFMYVYFEVLNASLSDTREACLIDVTSEATEIGIIRDGLLTHVTHIPFGTYTLAREISHVCNIPKEEAYTYLKGGESFIDTKLSKSKKNDLTIVLTAYEERLAHLFKQTGDTLAIPKSLYVHTDINTEAFFKKHVSEAARIATGIKHTVHMVTSAYVQGNDTSDTALKLSAKYFHLMHKQGYEQST